MGGDIPGGNFPGVNFPGGSLMGGNFPGGNFPEGNFPRTSKNEWLLLSESFTEKLELVFVLTFENAFSWSFHFKANRKIIGSSKKGY